MIIVKKMTVELLWFYVIINITHFNEFVQCLAIFILYYFHLPEKQPTSMMDPVAKEKKQEYSPGRWTIEMDYSRGVLGLREEIGWEDGWT